ncbi:MAG: hypothetical protein HQL56_10065 [Magnetococcales bacterium]|nr:hypothetical protein [Magnetococcales bacterium]
MLPRYEAIYDHGRLTWIGEAPGPVRTRVIVTPVSEPDTGESTEAQVPNGNRLAAILSKMAETNIAEAFGDPMEWQRSIRKDEKP